MYPRRVHIVPIRRGRDRVVTSLTSAGADRAYLLPDERGEGVPTDLVETLRDAGVDVECRPVDHADVYAVLGLVTTIAARHESDDDHVYVDVSTGSRLAAIGAALGCMDAATEAVPYHAGPDPRSGDDADDHRRIDPYPIDSPTRSQAAVLAVVAVETTPHSKPVKRTIIDRVVGLHLSLDRPLDVGRRIVESADAVDPTADDAGFDDLSSSEKKAAYRTLDAAALGRLVDDGHLRVVPAGRRDQLAVTERGENTLLAFRHRIDDVVRELDGPSMPDWLRDGIA
jgi:hypothetical protein